MNAYWFEIKRMLLNHKKTIVISSFIFAILLTILFPLLDRTENPVEELSVDVSDRAFDEDSKPAYFQFYIEHEDGSVFTNFATLEEVFNNEKVYSELNNELGIDLKQIKKDIRKQTPIVNYNPITVTLNGSSNILTALVDTGSDRNNLRVALYYYDLIFNKGFELLDNNYLYEIQGPQLLEETESDIDEKNFENPSTRTTVIDILKTGLSGLLMGVFLSVLFIFSKEFFSKKLNYLFGYLKIEASDFALYDSKLKNTKMITHFVGVPYGSEKIILSEDILSPDEQKLIINPADSNLSFKDDSKSTYLINMESLTDVQIKNNFTEIILIVVSGETSRDWYKQQLNLAMLHNLPVKTVQLNK